MRPCPSTPSEPAPRQAVRNACRLGLKVAVFFQQEAFNGTWRGTFCPRNRPAWFAGYRDQLVRVARLLAAERAGQLLIGGEMACLTVDAYDRSNSARWRSVIRSVRAVYRGQLGYSAQRDGQNRYGELDRITFWDALDLIGVSAHYPLYVSGAPTTAKLRLRWSRISNASFAPVARRWRKPLVLTEVGYRSVGRSGPDPYDYRRRGPLDLAEQARCGRAASRSSASAVAVSPAVRACRAAVAAELAGSVAKRAAAKGFSAGGRAACAGGVGTAASGTAVSSRAPATRAVRTRREGVTG